jgi:hypothetical protein
MLNQPIFLNSTNWRRIAHAKHSVWPLFPNVAISFSVKFNNFLYKTENNARASGSLVVYYRKDIIHELGSKLILKTQIRCFGCSLT